MERWYASDSKVRSLSQRTQQAAVCRAKSMRAGDRELPPPLVLLPSWHAILFHLYPCRNQPSSLACPPLAAFPPLFLSFVRILLRISGYTNAVGHAHPRFNPPLPFPAALRFLFPFPFPASPFLFHLHKDTANSPRTNKLYYFYQGFHLERTWRIFAFILPLLKRD